MATVIKLKRGTQTPTTSDIIDGEVAIDTSSQRLFARSGSDILQIGKDNFSDLTVSGTVIFEGSTADSFETTLTVTDPTDDRTITFPDATGTVSLLDNTETLTNKTLTNPTINAATFTGDVNFDSGTLFIDASTDRVGIGSSTLYKPFTIHNTTSAQIHLRTANPSIRFSSDEAGNSDATRGFIGFATNSSAFMQGSAIGDLVLRGKSQGNIIVGDNSGRYATFKDGGNLLLQGSLIFEGSTADPYETTLAVTDPTADRTLTLPDKSGTLATTDDLVAGTDTLSDVTGRGATTSDAITINNDLTVNGDTTLGDATSDNITFNGRISSNFVPAADNTYSLGTSSLKWSELHVSGSTIFLGDAQIQASTTKVVLPLESQVKTSTGASVRIAEANAGGIPIRNVPLFTKSGGLSTASTEFTFTAEVKDRKNYNGTFTLANGTQTAVNTDITLFEF